MPITVLGGTKVADTTFSVANSCRFNAGDSPRLSKGVSAGTSNTKFTFSCWFKSALNSTYGRFMWGGAASGKTTGAKLISKKYGLNLLSSGLLYRYVSYKLLAKKNNKNNISYLKSITKNITPNKLKNNKLYNPQVTQYASIIAKSKNIRNLLKKYQRKFSKRRLVCIEGRDIGSVICPNADIKLFWHILLLITRIPS